MSPEKPTATRPGELPKDFVPISYDLLIKTDLARKTFSGSGSILVKQAVPSATEIVFHLYPGTKLLSLGISSAADASLSTPLVELPRTAYRRDDRWQQVVVSLSTAGLSAGSIGRQLRVDAAWQGSLGMGQSGYYLSTYTDGSGADGDEVKLYAQTQFQPTAARRAFPCFDEPGLKATFQMRMLVQPTHAALNNMPIVDSLLTAASLADVTERQQIDAGMDARLLSLLADGERASAEGANDLQKLKLVKFERTPLMSSYLVAFATGDFRSVETTFTSKQSGRTIPLRIFATPNAIGEMANALKVTKKAVTLWEDVFQVAYPLPKLDTLSVSNFGGGMENFGLIVNTERAMRLPSRGASQEAKNRQLGLLAHEIAHQFFGDLVTCATWEQLWLNEGFASICGSLFAPSMLVPNWRARDAFIASEVWGALAADGRRTSHQIEVPLADPTKVNDIFDDITYKKGASVLLMIATLVGEMTFLKGVGNYLRKYAFGSATTLDLWAAVSEVSGIDVAEVAKNWTEKVGYPVITARVRSGKLHLKQNRFLATGDVRPADDQTLWLVPLQIKMLGSSGDSQARSVIMRERAMVIDLEGAKQVLVNAGSVGVYRVAYETDALQALVKTAVKSPKSISVTDAMSLLNDAHHLSRAGYGSPTVLLDVVRALAHPAQEHAIFAGVAQILDDLLNLFYSDALTHSALERFRLALFGPVVDRLGFDFDDESDSVETTQLRTLAIREAGLAGYKPVVEWTLREWDAWTKREKELASNTRPTVWALAVIHLGRPAHDRMMDILVSSSDNNEKKDAIFALVRTTSRTLVDRTLALIDDVAEVKEVDVRLIGIISGLAGNPRWKGLVWQWFKAHYDAIWTLVSGSMAARYVPLSPLVKVSTPATLADVKAFFSDRNTSEFQASLDQTIETVEASLSFLRRNAERGGEVGCWLRAQGYDSDAGRRHVASHRAAGPKLQSSLLYLF